MKQGELDYHAKIEKFRELTNTNDEDLAFDYLEKNNWDEIVAANNFFIDISKSGMFDTIPSSFRKTDGEKISRQQNPISTKNHLVNIMPHHALNMQDFYKKISSFIGILFIYNDKDVDVIEKHINDILLNKEMVNLLETEFITFILDYNSKEAKNLISTINEILIIPCCLFMYNPSHYDTNNSKVILEKIEGALNFEMIPLCIYKHLENKENLNHINDQQFCSLIQVDSDADIIKRQKDELKRLEEQEDEKIKKLKEKEELRIKKQKQILEEKEKQRINELNKRSIKLFGTKSIPIEPDANDINSTLIVFRLPGGNRVERRFNKKDKIDVLYNFLEFLEDENIKDNNFDLIQTFPYVLYNDREKTIEEERLYPNAVLQVREH